MVITALIQDTDHITEVMARMARATVQGIMEPIQALLRSRLATGRTIIAGLAITWALPITFGDRDIGDGAMVKESGSTDTTL